MASQTTYHIRNEKTQKVYVVTDEQWSDIQKAGWGGRYVIVDERRVVTEPKSSFIPEEIL